MNLKKLPGRVVILLSLTILSILIWFRTSDDPSGWQSVIGSDGRGYYAYLPAFITYGDPSFDSCAAIERALLKNPGYVPEYLVSNGTHTVNKYFIGVALLQLPFYCIAAVIAWAADLPLTGYSMPFQVMAGLGAVFYLVCGLWFLQRVLKRFVSKEWIIAFVLAAFTLGTNLLYYTAGAPLMSHVYSFFAVNGFLWAVSEAADRKGQIWYPASAIFLAVVILIRPVNAIVLLLVPAFAESYKTLLKPSLLLVFLATLLTLLFLQPLAWFAQTGHWFLWSYGNEGFNFLHPEIANILFSFRKGLFIYTPITFLSLTGFIFLYRSNKKIFFIFLIFFIFVIFLLSSWWNWYYGDGFGMRPAIDFYCFFAILLAVAIDHFRPVVSKMIAIAATLCIFLNLFQTWQYTQGIIHPFNMDLQKYSYIFLRSDSTYSNCLGGSDEVPWYGTDTSASCYHFRERNVYIDSLSKYNTGPNLEASLLPVFPGRYYLSGSFWVRDLRMGASNQILFVLQIFRADSVRDYWYGFPINDIPVFDTVSYRHIRFTMNSPVITNRDAYIKTYLWNPGGMVLKVVDFTLDFYPPSAAGSRVEENDSVSRNPLLTTDKP